MTRRFIDDVFADIDALMADNTEGSFVLAQDRQLRKDMVDSSVQDECYIGGVDLVGATFPVTGAYQGLSGVFNGTIGGDGIWLKPNQSAGLIVTNTIPGWAYEIFGVVSFTGANNSSYQFAISQDGVPGFAQPLVTATGASDVMSVSLDSNIQSSDPDTNIGISVRELGGTSQIEVLNAYLKVKIMPTYNPA